MKTTKRCACCNKPIWDHDYVTIYDPYMDADEHIHGQCYEAERLEIQDKLAEDAAQMDLSLEA